jgi:hypothetical protein
MWCTGRPRRQQCVLVFWHDAVAAALAADVTRAKALSGGRKRGADTLRSRISTTKVIRRRHARPHQHHPVKLTYSQDGTLSLSISNLYGRMRRAAVQSRMLEGSSNCSSVLVLLPKFLQIVHCRERCLLTQCYSLRPKSYVHPRSHRSLRPTEYSQPLQKTAQLWNKSKEDLAGQLSDLKSYVANLQKLGGMKY